MILNEELNYVFLGMILLSKKSKILVKYFEYILK
jgi:hypothetical protein